MNRFLYDYFICSFRFKHFLFFISYHHQSYLSLLYIYDFNIVVTHMFYQWNNLFINVKQPYSLFISLFVYFTVGVLYLFMEHHSASKLYTYIGTITENTMHSTLVMFESNLCTLLSSPFPHHTFFLQFNQNVHVNDIE